MAATATDTSILTKPVNAVFNAILLRNAKANCPYFAGSQTATVGMHRGTLTAKWRRINNLTPTTTPLTEVTGTAAAFLGRSAVTPTVTDVPATAQKFGQFIILTEEADLTNFNGQDAKLVEIIGISAGRSFNQLQRDVVEDNFGLTYVGGGASDGTVTSKITATAIETVVNSLQRQDAMAFSPMTMGSQNVGTTPILPAYWGLCHPDVGYDVAKITGFKSVETYAGQIQTMPGEIGLYGIAGQVVRFVTSSDASIDTNSGGATSGTTLRGSTNVDLYTTVIYGREAAGSLGFDTAHVTDIYTAGDRLPTVELISHARGSAGAFDALNEISTLGWKGWHAGAVLNSNWGQGIRSGATDLTG